MKGLLACGAVLAADILEVVSVDSLGAKKFRELRDEVENASAILTPTPTPTPSGTVLNWVKAESLLRFALFYHVTLSPFYRDCT